MTHLRLVVARTPGRVRLLPPQRFADGREVVAPGQPLAVVEANGTSTVVTASVGGVVDGLLVHEGEPVVPGQPIMAVRP